jgi:hypothetical protein
MAILIKTLTVSVVILLISCSNIQNNVSNKTNIPKFEVNFPKTEFKIAKTETEDQSVVITNLIMRGKDINGPFMYYVAYNEIPQVLKSNIKRDSSFLRMGFKAALMGSAEKLGGTNFRFSEIKYKDYQGMESVCDVFDGNGIIKSRIYKVDDYLFIISGGGKHICVDTINNFLNSLKLK